MTGHDQQTIDVDDAAFQKAWECWCHSNFFAKFDRDISLKNAIRSYLAHASKQDEPTHGEHSALSFCARPQHDLCPTCKRGIKGDCGYYCEQREDVVSLVRDLHDRMQSEAGRHYLEGDLGERTERFLAGCASEISNTVSETSRLAGGADYLGGSAFAASESVSPAQVTGDASTRKDEVGSATVAPEGVETAPPLTSPTSTGQPESLHWPLLSQAVNDALGKAADVAVNDQPAIGTRGTANDGTAVVFGDPIPGKWCRGGVLYAVEDVTVAEQPDQKPLHHIKNGICSICWTDALRCNFWKSYPEAAQPDESLLKTAVIDAMIDGVRAWNDETADKIMGIMRPYLRGLVRESISAEQLSDVLEELRGMHEEQANQLLERFDVRPKP